jgi:hypothetical protein
VKLSRADIARRRGEEFVDEPWFVIVDIGQVAAAALIDIFVLPFVVCLLQRAARLKAR